MKPKTPKFTIRVEEPNPFREGTVIWRAGQIVIALRDCAVPSIVDALKAFTRDATPKGTGDPARWLTHFAGLESDRSGKARRPWIAILHNGESVRSTAEFRNLLRDP
jgi:hypothetical protein